MTSRMFPFITKTWNPLGGKCGFECSYCWAKALTKRHNFKKYQGVWYVDEKQLLKSFTNKDFVFLQDMNDISFCPLVSLYPIFSRIEGSSAKFLTLTKNPRYFLDGKKWFLTPLNVIIGATIETNRSIPENISKAPQPSERLHAMFELQQYTYHKLFISIEPIMDFDLDEFAKRIILIKPWAVAVGYDNYNNHLIEPSMSKTEELIKKLEANGITVYRKTIREAITIGDKT